MRATVGYLASLVRFQIGRANYFSSALRRADSERGQTAVPKVPTLLTAVAATVWVAVGAAGAIAQTIPGEQDYRNNCAVCHGPTGKGDGEAVTVLPALKPKDLSQLTKNNHGEFPAQEIYQAIDGRDNIAAHELGEGRTPTWGVNWQLGAGQPNPTSGANTRQRVQDLVSYIKTLQQK